MLRLISFDLINIVLHVTKTSVHMFPRVLLSILLRVIYSHSRSWFKIIIYPLSSESLLFCIMLTINFRQQSTIEDMCSYATGKTQVHSFQSTRNTADRKKTYMFLKTSNEARLFRSTHDQACVSLSCSKRPTRPGPGSLSSRKRSLKKKLKLSRRGRRRTMRTGGSPLRVKIGLVLWVARRGSRRAPCKRLFLSRVTLPNQIPKVPKTSMWKHSVTLLLVRVKKQRLDKGLSGALFFTLSCCIET